MPKYVIELSDVEQRAMEYISTDVDFWIQNAVHERARVAMEEMVQEEITQTLAAGGSVSGTKEDIVMRSALPNAQMRNKLNIAAAEQMVAATMAEQTKENDRHG